MGNFISNLFAIRKADGTISKTTIAGWVSAFAVALAATPGGPELMSGALVTLGKYAPLAIALVSVLSGAAINHDTSTPKE